MCSLAPRAAALGFGATTFLDRQRGVVASAMAAAAISREPTHRARVSEASAAPARKRGRHDDAFEYVGVVDPAAASSSALRSRMDKEFVALEGLLKRAKLMPRRSTPPAEKNHLPAPRRSEPPAVSSPLKPAKETTAYAPAKQQRPAAKNPIAPEVHNKQQRPVPAPAKQKQQSPVVQRAAAVAKTADVSKKRRPEEEEKELARAAARAAFRQMLVDMEKSALKDETVYPEEMEALGIPFEFLVTRTWKQAMLDYQAKKVECS